LPAEILTLTLNPAVDLSTSVAHVEPQTKLRCQTVRRDPGGGGVNVARVLKRFGLVASAIYPTGSSTGELLARGMLNENIKSIAIPIAGETREDFTVTETDSGNQFRFVMPGPALAQNEWLTCLDAMENAVPKPDIVVASGSLPPGVPPDFYARVARTAKKLGAKLVLDTSGKALAEALKEGVWLIKPNLRELRELTGAELPDEASRIAAARVLVKKAAAEIVALSLAEEGALLVTRDEAFRARAPAIKAVSTVGAGDSFLGGMVWRLALGHGLSDALAHGVAAGTAALLSPGTGLCHPDTVAELLPQISVEKL
jgi:6-phosphofructokinase 2